MSLLHINGTEEDVIHDLWWVFKCIGICESTCPALATCRRSLDAHNRMGPLIESDTKETAKVCQHKSTTVRLRCTGNTNNDTKHNKGVVGANDDKTDDDDRCDEKSEPTCTRNEKHQSVPDDNMTSSELIKDELIDKKSRAVLLSAYYDFVGPGLKSM